MIAITTLVAENASALAGAAQVNPINAARIRLVVFIAPIVSEGDGAGGAVTQLACPDCVR